MVTVRHLGRDHVVKVIQRYLYLVVILKHNKP